MDIILLLVVGFSAFASGFLLCYALNARKQFRLEQAKLTIETLEKDNLTLKEAVEKWRLEMQSAREDKARAEQNAAITTDLQKKIIQLTAEIAEARAKLAEQEETFKEKEQSLIEIREKIEKDMQTIASKALIDNQGKFIELANELFEKHRKNAEGEIDNRKVAIETMLKPIAETLSEYKKSLDDIEKQRHEAYGSLSNELKNVVKTQNDVKSETAKLVNALRSAPKTRGRWGEETLKNVMEMSGMSPYCDFSFETTFNRDEQRLRPDVIINLPGSRHIVVDAKTSMSAYMNAIEADNEIMIEEFLKQHAQQIRSHMKQLADKKYWDSLTVTPDFVVMFIPGENFFAAAMERDPELFEDAVNARVLIVTPTTFIALAKAIAFGWRQEKVAENAVKVSELGRELYKRLSIMGGHIDSMGKSLDTVVKRYNGFIGSLESNVLTQARRFSEYEVEGTSTPLPELPLIETEVRDLRKLNG